MTPLTCWRSVTAATPPTCRSKMSPAARRGWHSTTTVARSIASRRPGPAPGAAPVLLEERQMGARPRPARCRRAGLLGDLRLPHVREPMARTALRRRLTWQAATVTAVTRETASVVTIELEPPDWPGHRAGQHLEVRLTAEDGYTAERQYSIASAPVSRWPSRRSGWRAARSHRTSPRSSAPGMSWSCAARSAATSSGSRTTAGRCYCWPADWASSRCGPSCGTAAALAATSRRACCTPPARCRT